MSLHNMDKVQTTLLAIPPNPFARLIYPEFSFASAYTIDRAYINHFLATPVHHKASTVAQNAFSSMKGIFDG